MITACPLDSPQLSTTLEEESHCDPTSSKAMVWQGRYQENPEPLPIPSGLGKGGWGWGGRAVPEDPERPAKPKTLYNHGLFLERTPTFGARRHSCKLEQARQARACSLSAVSPEWAWGRSDPPDLGQHHLAALGPRSRGRRETGARASLAGPAGPRTREGVARRSLPWARPARPVRVARLRPGTGRGGSSKAPHGCELTRQCAPPVRPQPPGARL